MQYQNSNGIRSKSTDNINFYQPDVMQMYMAQIAAYMAQLQQHAKLHQQQNAGLKQNTGNERNHLYESATRESEAIFKQRVERELRQEFEEKYKKERELGEERRIREDEHTKYRQWETDRQRQEEKEKRQKEKLRHDEEKLRRDQQEQKEKGREGREEREREKEKRREKEEKEKRRDEEREWRDHRDRLNHYKGNGKYDSRDIRDIPGGGDQYRKDIPSGGDQYKKKIQTKDICRHYNSDEGCDRSVCWFKHISYKDAKIHNNTLSLSPSRSRSRSPRRFKSIRSKSPPRSKPSTRSKSPHHRSKSPHSSKRRSPPRKLSPLKRDKPSKWDQKKQGNDTQVEKPKNSVPKNSDDIAPIPVQKYIPPNKKDAIEPGEVVETEPNSFTVASSAAVVSAVVGDKIKLATNSHNVLDAINDE